MRVTEILTARFVLAFLVFFLSFSDVLRMGVGYFSWIPLVILAAHTLIKIDFSKNLIALPFIFFVFLVAINSFVAPDQLNSILRSAKLLLIFSFVFFIIKNKDVFTSIVAASITVTVLNFGFLVLGFLGYSEVAHVGGGVRWETIFSAPGTLYASGVVVVLFFLSDLLLRTQILEGFGVGRRLFFLMVSLLVIFADGSRSAILSILLAFVVIAVFAGRRIFFVLALLLLFFCVYYSFYFFSYEGFSGLISFERISSIFGSSGLSDVDPERALLLNNSLGWISINNPIFFGKGFSSTISDDDFQLVVHNAYILVWEQLGLVALLVFLVIIFFPLFLSLYFRFKTGEASYVLASSFFVFYSLVLFFHPLATEYGPWVFYWIGMAFLFRRKFG